MSAERLSRSLVIIGVLLLATFVAGQCLPSIADMSMPLFRSSRPSLHDWPAHELPDAHG